MSRRRDVEIMFGSDSFLDVVCNIVGILIILIVIAGVRMSKMPLPKNITPGSEEVTLVTPAPSTSVETPDLADSSIVMPEPTSDEPEPAPALTLPDDGTPSLVEADASAKPIEPEPLPPLPELAPSPELVEKVERLEAEVASLADESEELSRLLKSQHQKQLELHERLAAIRERLAARQQDIDARRQQTAEQKRDLALARQTLARLLAEARELDAKTPPVESLQHRITPVSRTVSGKEKHFRLAGDRIAEVPVEVLVTKLKDQIERRKDWLMKTRSHQGKIGPFMGFSMAYQVRAEPLSDFEALRAGQHGFRLTVQSWEVIPEPDLKGETADEALQQGSRFYLSLVDADPDTTLTFWVYPDSFSLHRSLQAFAHDQGFRVAARPLPKGIPIAGSPSGSKSASQ